MHLGATLRLLRLSSGFSLRELASRVGVSSAYLSRVENGLDPVPTQQRLLSMARELDVPEALLLDSAHRVSPLAMRFTETRPRAASLLLEMARRDLDDEALEEVRRFVTKRFPVRGKVEGAALAPLLRGVRVQVQCGDLDDAIEVGCLELDARPLSPSALPRLFGDAQALASTAVGNGVAVPWALAPSVESQVAVVTLSRALKMATPDDVPVTVVVLVLSRDRSTDHLASIARVARMASRGLASELAGIGDVDDARHRFVSLE